MIDLEKSGVKGRFDKNVKFEVDWRAFRSWVAEAKHRQGLEEFSAQCPKLGLDPLPRLPGMPSAQPQHQFPVSPGVSAPKVQRSPPPCSDPPEMGTDRNGLQLMLLIDQYRLTN